MNKVTEMYLLRVVHKLGYFMLAIFLILGLLIPWSSFSIVQAAPVRPIENLRYNTIEVYMNAYSSADGNCTGGTCEPGEESSPDTTDLSIGTTTWTLHETDVDIVQAYLVVQGQLSGNVAPNLDTTGYTIAFNTANGGTPNPWGGFTNVQITDSTTLFYDENESLMYRLLADVSSEFEIATYTGGGTPQYSTYGVKFEGTRTTAEYSLTTAKLVLTYSYSERNTTTYTNQVLYPLESTGAGDQGTAIAQGQESSGTLPSFAVNAEIAELGVEAPDKMNLELQYMSNNITGGSLGRLEPRVGGVSYWQDHFIDMDNGGAQGNGWHPFFKFRDSQTILNANTAYTITTDAFGANHRFDVVGGELATTYNAPTTSATKTKTIMIPVGEVHPGDIGTLSQDTITSVYIPEDGYSIKKAWYRIRTSMDATSSVDMDLSTKVGTNAASLPVTYQPVASTNVVKPSFTIYHVIPSSDYAHWEATSNATTPINITLTTFPKGPAIQTSSAELMITYTYTGETNGYNQTIRKMVGQDVTAPGNSSTLSAGTLAFDDELGYSRIEGSLDVSLMTSDSSGDNQMPGADKNVVGSDFDVTGACSASGNHRTAVDLGNTLDYYYRTLPSGTIVATDDTTAYDVCFVHANENEAAVVAKQNAVIGYTNQINIQTIEQSGYRFFVNADSADVGAFLAAENAEAKLTSDGQPFRLRMLHHIGGGGIPAESMYMDLQFADRIGLTCGDDETWIKVTGSTDIAFYDNPSVASSVALIDNDNDPGHSGHSVQNQFYTETNTYNNLTAAVGVASGDDAMWDFALFDNSASNDSEDYCFRGVIAEKDGTTKTLFDTYTEYPVIFMAATPTVNTITIDISDSTVGFGSLSVAGARYATGDTLGTGTETAAHTVTVSTDATNGFTLTLQGDTLTHQVGPHTINAIGGTATALSAGTEAFGIRATETASPDANVIAPYNDATNYGFNATSTTSDVLGQQTSTNATAAVYDIFYGATIAAATEAGDYTGTLTYIATGNF